MNPNYEIKQDEHTPTHVRVRELARQIFENIYIVKVPQAATYTEEYLDLMGVHSTMNEQFDRDLMDSETTVGLTVEKMVELWQKGYTIKALDQDTVEDIYKLISEYLNAWRDHLRYSPHVRATPVEDLKLLDEFATVIYRNAPHILAPNELEDLLAAQLTSSGFKPIFNKASDTPKKLTDVERDSIAEDLERFEHKLRLEPRLL